MDHVRQAFNRFAHEYDRHREYIIPGLRQFYGTAVWAAESECPAPEILDIGAGTGLMSAWMLEKFPDAHLTLVDIAENMLAVARERFSGREHTRYLIADYSTADLGGPYDIACSALSIHHLATEDKRRLFGRIHAALKPGGMFVNADQADGETRYFRGRYLEYWNRFLNDGPMSEEEHAEILKRRDTLDRNERLSDQLAWLKEAGFSHVDVVYRNRTFVVTVAKRE